MIRSLTVIRQVFGLQELGGERAVRVLVGLLVARLSALPVAAPERSLLGGARRDPPPPSLDDEHRQLHEPRQGNHDDTNEASDDTNLSRTELDPRHRMFTELHGEFSDSPPGPVRLTAASAGG